MEEQSSSLLNKVLEDLDACSRFADRIIVAVFLRAPNKIQRRTERLISPRESCVDNELSVTTYRNKTAVWRVEEGLWVDFAGT